MSECCASGRCEVCSPSFAAEMRAFDATPPTLPCGALADVREQMIATGKCPRCHHKPDQHHHNACHHFDPDKPLGLRRCDCWYSGPTDWAAAALWNSYMGRSVQ